VTGPAFLRQGLEVVPLSPHEWRVSDPGRDEHDGLSLLGFVEEVAGGFEVTAIGHPGHRTVHPDLNAALRVLRDAHIRL
jgi:hypothetical protein